MSFLVVPSKRVAQPLVQVAAPRHALFAWNGATPNLSLSTGGRSSAYVPAAVSFGPGGIARAFNTTKQSYVSRLPQTVYTAVYVFTANTASIGVQEIWRMQTGGLRLEARTTGGGIYLEPVHTGVGAPTTLIFDASTRLFDNTPIVYVIRYDGTTVKQFVRWPDRTIQIQSDTLGYSAPSGTMDMGGTANAHQALSLFITDELYSEVEIFELLRNPFGAFPPVRRQLWASAAGGVTITPASGVLALAGLAPTVSLSSSQTITPAAGALVLAGLAPSVTYSLPAPDPGALILAGNAPTVIRGTVTSPSVGTLALSGLAPTVTLTQNVLASPVAGALSLAGLAPTVVRGTLLTPQTGALALEGAAPAITNGGSTTLQPTQGALALVGLAPTVTQTTNATVQPSVGALALAGLAPTVVTSNSPAMTPTAGALALVGLAPTVVVTQNVVVNPLTGALVFVGVAPGVATSNNLTLTPSTGALALTGLAPTIPVASPEATPTAGALALQGYAPSVTVTGDNVLDAKFLGRPNVRIKPLRDLAPKPHPPLPAQITNMPDAPVLPPSVAPLLARGVDLSLIPDPPTPSRASPAAARSVPVPTAAPAPAPAPVAVASAALPPAPVPPENTPPATASPSAPQLVNLAPETQALLADLLGQMKASSAESSERMVVAVGAVETRIAELTAQIEADRKARDLKERNLLRAKQLAERLLGDSDK